MSEGRPRSPASSARARSPTGKDADLVLFDPDEASVDRSLRAPAPQPGHALRGAAARRTRRGHVRSGRGGLRGRAVPGRTGRWPAVEGSGVSDFTTLPDLAPPGASAGWCSSPTTSSSRRRRTCCEAGGAGLRPRPLHGSRQVDGRLGDAPPTRSGPRLVHRPPRRARIVRGVVVDTSFFRGNYPDRCSVEGAVVEEDDVTGAQWFDLVPESALEGDAINRFDVASPLRVSHLRLNIFPDGGVARLRVHGEPLPDLRTLTDAGGRADVAASVGTGSCSTQRPLLLLTPQPDRAGRLTRHARRVGDATPARRGPRLGGDPPRDGDRDRAHRGRHLELQGQLPGHVLARGSCDSRRRRRPGGRAGLVRGPLAPQAGSPSTLLVPDRPAGAGHTGSAEHPSRRRRGAAPGARAGHRRRLALVRRSMAQREDARGVRGARARLLRLARLGERAPSGEAVRDVRRAAADRRRCVGRNLGR